MKTSDREFVDQLDLDLAESASGASQPGEHKRWTKNHSDLGATHQRVLAAQAPIDVLQHQ